MSDVPRENRRGGWTDQGPTLGTEGGRVVSRPLDLSGGRVGYGGGRITKGTGHKESGDKHGRMGVGEETGPRNTGRSECPKVVSTTHTPRHPIDGRGTVTQTQGFGVGTC